MHKVKLKTSHIIIVEVCVLSFIVTILFPYNSFSDKKSLNAGAATQAQSSIRLVSLPGICFPGEYASIKIQGWPNTEYSIKVKYNSGYSEASGLYRKTSDNNGYVSWSWKVGTRTASGKYPITISGGGETKKVYFTVD